MKITNSFVLLRKIDPGTSRSIIVELRENVGLYV
jgi:hypothetical protein